MTTISARAGDRMDILAARVDGELTTATLGAWLRANPDLAYALPVGTEISMPSAEERAFDYGASYVPLDKSNLPVSPRVEPETVYHFRATTAVITSEQLESLHLTPVEVVPAPGPHEGLLPVAAILQVRGDRPGQVAGYEDRENLVLGWLDSYESGGIETTHRPVWGRTTLDALIAAGLDDATSPAFGILMENRLLWQPGFRPGRPLAVWLTEALAPVPADTELDVTVCYVIGD